MPGCGSICWGRTGCEALGDFDRGAFESVPDDVVSVYGVVFARDSATRQQSMALLPTPPRGHVDEIRCRTHRKRAATLCHEGRHTFDPAALKVVPEWPLVYWWEQF